MEKFAYKKNSERNFDIIDSLKFIVELIDEQESEEIIRMFVDKDVYIAHALFPWSSVESDLKSALLLHTSIFKLSKLDECVNSTPDIKVHYEHSSCFYNFKLLRLLKKLKKNRKLKDPGLDKTIAWVELMCEMAPEYLKFYKDFREFAMNPFGK